MTRNEPQIHAPTRGCAACRARLPLAEVVRFALDGDLPVNMSGGVLCTNPIGASGMLRFGEIAMQVRGTAGEHQVDGVRRGLGHAYGGGSQFFAMWIVGADKP